MNAALFGAVAVAAVALSLLPATAAADPITFAVRGDTFVQTVDFTALPPEIVRESTQIDEIFGADDLGLITSSLAGSGPTTGYVGSASARIIDSVIGAYATLAAAGSATVSSTSSGYGGYIDYFTVLLPAGNFVPMRFALAPSYTIETTGDACGRVQAGIQVGIDASFVGSLSYLDSSCQPDSLLTEIELMVPTGVPFRVLYEMSASALVERGMGGTATVDALNSLRLFADAVGNYSYMTESGNSFLSAPTAVPEPASLLTLGVGLAALAYRRRQRR